jgi:TPR repeat protein
MIRLAAAFGPLAAALVIGLAGAAGGQGGATVEADALKAAEAGDAEAQYALGARHESGDGVARDPVQAFAWYEKAAAQGHAGAMFAIAEMFIGGAGGTESDPSMASFWYMKAAEKGHRSAQARLGLMYGLGLAVAADAARAFYWLTLAARQGDAQAALLVARLSGEMDEADMARARALFEQAGLPLP